MMRINPRDIGVPHDTWRESQWEAWLRVEKIMNEGGGTFIACLATGSGKSVLPTAMGHFSNVLVCVHTLGLLEQYEARYGFTIIKGRQEYPCILQSKLDNWKRKFNAVPNASDCHFSRMHQCPISKKCPYLIAKRNAVSAQRSACTYRYASISRAMQDRGGNIVFDEAHDAAEELISFQDFEVSQKYIDYWKLPSFPFGEYGEENRGGLITKKDTELVEKWLYKCIERFGKFASGGDMKGSRAQKSMKKFVRMYEFIATQNWFLQMFPYKFTIKTLDAQNTAQAIFANKFTKVLMSATIGDPEPLTHALGIDSYEFESYPHPVPKKYRSVKNLHFKRMTKRNLDNNPLQYHEQAIVITKWVRQFPVEWRGLMLTASYKKIKHLYANLLIVLPERRFIVQFPGEKIGRLVERFINDFQPGDIMIGTVQGMGSGLDLYGNLARWMVVAGVPFTNPQDEYAKARRKAFGGIGYQNWNTYVSIVQACGRVSRGERDENGTWLPNYAALADGSATTGTAKKYYPDWFLESMDV